MMTARFHIPDGLPAEQQVPFCIQVINKLRDELSLFRQKATYCQTNHTPIITQFGDWKNSQIEYWRDKYEEEKQKRRDIEEEYEKVKKENEKLKKTNNRLNISVFDHGNFKHPDNKGKKKKGGQPGHANTNKDAERDYASYPKKRIFAEFCGGCGEPLTRGNGIKRKILLDIILYPEVLNLVLLAERQWCGTCKKEVRAAHPQSLPFTEYGLNTLMVVLYLRFKGKQSLRVIALMLNLVFGLSITKSGVDTLLTQAKNYLGGKYEELKQAIRDGEIMYNDETGWTVRGKSAWMWIMATPDKVQEDGSIESGMTVYVAAESKGKGVFEEMYGNSKALSMHDGNPTYKSVVGEENSLSCWSHVLRFAYEETFELDSSHSACQIRDRLVILYHEITTHPKRSNQEKEKIMREELDALLAIECTHDSVGKIQHRIKTQKEDLIHALLYTKDGTNNLAEREFRGLVIMKDISYGSDTYSGMEKTAILASIVQTLSRDTSKPFFPTLSSYLKQGMQEKYFQQKHIPVLDGL